MCICIKDLIMHLNRLKEGKYLHEQDIFELKTENYANTSSTSSISKRNNKLLDKINGKVASYFSYDGDSYNNDDDQDCVELEE